MIAIAPTDLDWFTQLRQGSLPELVNFWTPTPWNVRGLGTGDRLYFLLKAPIRKIGGFGAFVRYENLSVEHAWKKYGVGNGVQSLDELLERTRGYVGQRSVKGSVEVDTDIGCIVLSRLVLFDDSDFFAPESKGLSFPRQVVKIKYFKGASPEILDVSKSFALPIDEPFEPYRITESQQRVKRIGLLTVRLGQSRFRETVLEAYSRRCAISREGTEEILEAAHIQPYSGAASNHVQNGLALRTDLHKLFDAGLLTIGQDLRVKVSGFIKSALYRDLNTQPLHLPEDIRFHPSNDALEFHRRNVFRTAD